MVRRVYRNPPIQEALCQVVFHSTSWSFGSPAAIYELLRDAYPAEPEQIIESGLQITPSKAPSFRLEPQVPHVRFSSSEGNRTVMVGPTTLSIHVLSPYPGWEDFRRRIANALESYLAVVRPDSVSRIGVRYINRIVINEASFSLNDYFTYAPSTPDELDVVIADFFVRLESGIPGSSRRLIQNFGSAGSEGDSAAFVLDLDAIEAWEAAPGLPATEALAAIETLRDFEREAFEALITDELRAVFDA
jgi:uncharacterized protein (TIGR04255 family)